MSYAVLTDQLRVARKGYVCNSCEWWLESGYTLEDCDTEAQREAVKAAKADGWRILPGQKYGYQSGLFDGEFFASRSRTDMHQVCLDLDLYPEP